MTLEESATVLSQQILIVQMAKDAATQDAEIELLREANVALHQINSDLNAQIVALKWKADRWW